MAQHRTARRIALIYAAFSMAWIVLSDRILAWLAPDLNQMLRFQTIKGLFFVTASALLVFLLIRGAERQRERGERQRRRDEERLRLALAGADLGMWDYHAATGDFTSDARGAEIIGRGADDVPMTLAGWHELIHPDDLTSALQAQAAHARGATPRFEAEVRLRHAAGHWVWVLARGKITERDAEGRLLRACGTYLDISDRRGAEEERARLGAQLRQAQKLEAIGQLAGGVAHDFNNLLQVINGYAELALLDLPADHPARGPVSEVTKAGRRAAGLVAQLLAFGRCQLMTPTDIDLNDVVGDMLTMLERVIGEHIELTFTAEANLPAIRGDRSMLEQLVMNLCVNARDAMPDGGRLSLETRFVRVDAAYAARHDLARTGDFVQLLVADTGVGMDDATRGRIFEPFFSTKPPGVGSGLGLATVYGVVEQHGGLISVTSEPGRGSVFRVCLPATRHRAVAATAPVAATARGGCETILLAEDDEGVRRLAQQVLEKAGYHVIAAPDGLEAVRQFAARADAVDLVMLDVVMPGSGGPEAYARMSRIRPDVPVLFATGYSDGFQMGRQPGEAHPVLPKPFGREELLAAVRAAIENARPAAGEAG